MTSTNIKLIFVSIIYLLLSYNVSWAQNELPFISTSDSTYQSLFSNTKADSIKKLIGNADIVLLGEPTHGEGNIFELKTEMVKFLHEQMGFNVIAFESGFIDLGIADQMLKDPNISTNTVLENSVFDIWTKSAQFQPLIQYINQNKENLNIAGFDSQFSGNYAMDFFIEHLEEFIKEKIKETDNPSIIDYDYMDQVIGFMAENYSFSAEHLLSYFKKQTSETIKTLDKLENLDTDDERKKNFLIQCLKSNLALAEDYAVNHPNDKTVETFKASDSNFRDRQMADNILFLLNYFKGKKIICWGANSHFANRVDLLNNEELQNYQPVGRILKPILKDRLCIIGTTAGSGNYGIWSESAQPVPSPQKGSLEELLNLKNIFAGIVDLRNFKGSKTSTALEHKTLSGEWSQVFDLLLYVKSTAPSKLYSKTLLSSPKNSEPSLPGNFVSHKEIYNEIETNAKSFIITAIVTDSDTDKPVPFAKIELTGSKLHTVANSSGEFNITPVINPADSLKVSGVGYESQTFPTTYIANHPKIRLTPSNTELDEIVINVEQINPVDILREAILNIPKNYIQTDFNAECYVRAKSSNNDTLISDEEYIVTLYAKDGYREDTHYQGIVSQANIQKTPSSSHLFIPLTGSSAWLNNADLLKTNPLFDLKQLKKFDVKLDSIIYQGNDKVYVITFKAKRSTSRVTGMYYMKAYSGTIFIKHSDKAILKTIVSWERDSSLINRFAQKSVGKTTVNPIFSNQYNYERITLTNLYERNASGKYAVYYGLMSWEYEGKSIREGKTLKVHSSLLFLTNSITVNNIQKIDRNGSLYYLSAVPKNEIFWKNYSRPLLNE